jgi:membrane fusion protein (multidrug efflux system)
MITKKMKKNILIAAIILICTIAFIYWIYNQFHASTDDAYVNANVVQIAPRVTGQVQHLYVVNNQYVKEGQLLFDLDPATFITAIDQAKAQLALSQANLTLAQATDTRTTTLVKRKVASMQEADNAQASLSSAEANVQLATANLAQAQLNLRYTKIYAPTSGWVTNVTLRAGAVISANQSQFALISDSEYWIDANFKETALMRIHSGQPAEIEVDMYPGYIFQGKVESISGGSGTAFSLLPPENATGNWVKVTQRVPVRIRILNPNSKYPLRIGTSANVTIRISPWSN